MRVCPTIDLTTVISAIAILLSLKTKNLVIQHLGFTSLDNSMSSFVNDKNHRRTRKERKIANKLIDKDSSKKDMDSECKLEIIMLV